MTARSALAHLATHSPSWASRLYATCTASVCPPPSGLDGSGLCCDTDATTAHQHGFMTKLTWTVFSCHTAPPVHSSWCTDVQGNVSLRLQIPRFTARLRSRRKQGFSDARSRRRHCALLLRSQHPRTSPTSASAEGSEGSHLSMETFKDNIL